MLGLEAGPHVGVKGRALGDGGRHVRRGYDGARRGEPLGQRGELTPHLGALERRRAEPDAAHAVVNADADLTGLRGEDDRLLHLLEGHAETFSEASDVVERNSVVCRGQTKDQLKDEEVRQAFRGEEE